LLTALSLSKWSAFPEGAITSILRDASGGKLRSTESSDAAEPMFAYEDRKVPGEKRVVVAPRGRG